MSDRTVSLSLYRRVGFFGTIAVVLLGIEHFGRYDLLGIAVQNGVDYHTATGRLIRPTSIDETQYMSYVQRFRGVPIAELPEVWWPFNNRTAIPFLASRLPFRDEGVAIAVTNLVVYIAAIWIILDVLRRRNVTKEAFLLTAILLVVNWNTAWFSTGVLIDPGVLLFFSISCWLICADRVHWLIPLMLLGYPVKELALGVVAIVAVWAVADVAQRRRRIVIFGGTLVAAVVSFLIFHSLLVPDQSFDDTPRFGVLFSNLEPVALAALFMSFGPILLFALARIRQQLRNQGLRTLVQDPMIVGFGLGIALLGYASLGADLSPRLFFPALPFATVLAADGLDNSAQKWTKRFFALPIINKLFRPDALDAVQTAEA